MKQKAFSLRHAWSAWLLVAVVGGATGCATKGRHVLLKEYRATVPAEPGGNFQGKVVCIKPFACAPDLAQGKPETEAEQPEGFSVQPLSSEDAAAWLKEWKALKGSTTEADWWPVGRLRNGFGMVLSKVYALNDPGQWLADTLRLDLEAQGMRVVGPDEEAQADIVVGGTIRLCSVDIYMKIWADLVVEVDFQIPGKDPQQRVVHTNGGTVAWIGSKEEFYKPLRECQQKFSLRVIREIGLMFQ